MKCPRCGFISFDYNQTCPKCGNDLSRERELMNFPSYAPKPLTLLGALTGNAGIPAIDTGIAQSEAFEEAADDLLISLASLSDEASQPFQFEPVSPLKGPQKTMEGEGADLEDGLTISLDDFSDESPEFIPFSPQEEVSAPQMEIEDEILFEPEIGPTEEPEPEKKRLRESDTIEPGMFGMELDVESSKKGIAPDKGEDASGKEEKMEADLFELELEPLELDLEGEDLDKKAT